MEQNEKIKYYRKLLRLTQDEVGDACSVDRSTVANWEAGSRKVNRVYIKILTALFGLPPYELERTEHSSESKLVDYKMKNNIRIGEYIVRDRKKYGMTQGEFGKLLGVSAFAVSKWEREICYPDIFLLADISDILDISIDEMMGK